MKTPRRLGVTGSNRSWLLYTALAISFCLIIPMATAYASGQEGSGTVACKVTYSDGTGANIQYPVELAFPKVGLTLVGRWGLGNDVTYEGQVTAHNSSGRQATFYLYSLSDPNNPDTPNQLYSETAKLDFSVNKDGKFHLTGKSLVVMDFSFASDHLELGAECTWKLSGSVPVG